MFALVFGIEGESILAAALVQHIHELAWLCLYLCVYVAD